MQTQNITHEEPRLTTFAHGRKPSSGKGSRLRLFMCDCPNPIRVRVARDEFNCTCNTCNTLFHRGA